MKQILLLPCLLIALTLPAQIEWLDWEEAMVRQQSEPRKVLIDVYTDWCGWCKEMDKKVFASPEIADHIAANFYAVKLNAEQTADITFDGHVFSHDAGVGRRGVHALAVALLDGRMSYPSVVYLDENNKRITISPGYKPAETYLTELTYISGEHFKRSTFQDYLKKASK